MENLTNLIDFEKKAREILELGVYDYFAGGADDEATLASNQSAFKQIKLKPRVLVDVSKRSTKTRFLGHELSAPVVIAPTAFQGMTHADAELGIAKAAGEFGTIMSLSTMSNCALEDVKQATSAPLWFQLYVCKNRQVTQAAIERAEQAGYEAIVVTVDAPVFGRRERDIKNNFKIPDHFSMPNLVDSTYESMINAGNLAEYTNNAFENKLNWSDIQWVKECSRLPVFIKGIMHEEDAKIALDYGVDGIICSNHGGRQLDTSAATIELLPAITNVIQGKIPVLVDGGVRRGTDIFKAIALGADAVLVGRPVVWGLAIGGANGVYQVLNHLKDEFDNAMALAGFNSVDEIREKGHSILFR
ncbi:alpha-hydroxy acid oxidase [Piscirickettsia litoralis]|uniref:FMN hydroxy acid dehydrogenase domain-containing protein n=1 Tax=Piscirickettsia litoralis TaxID=1891921 RepID=A0ABX3A7U5_9GAMM|nr:alpha-hydroxy acid oxidase [Piscirickettsia litoralis]ODN43703.1 hypothetical protein BGC07_13325 [Piscirickettsia litoralis]